MHALLQVMARMHGPRSEACVGLQSLQQYFASSPSHSAKRKDADDQAQPAGDVDSAQAAAGQQQAAADGAEQSANGAAAPQEPPTLEDLQAELNTQREASEGHAAEVRTKPSSCITEQPFTCRWSNTCPAGACTASLPVTMTFMLMYCTFLQAADMKDRLLRALAEMENLRERSARQIESNKQFAVQVPSRLGAVLWQVELQPLHGSVATLVIAECFGPGLQDDNPGIAHSAGLCQEPAGRGRQLGACGRSSACRGPAAEQQAASANTCKAPTHAAAGRADDRQPADSGKWSPAAAS